MGPSVVLPKEGVPRNERAASRYELLSVGSRLVLVVQRGEVVSRPVLEGL